MTLFLGPDQAAFEQKCSARCQVRHGVGVSNGTDVLHDALRASGIGPRDEVFTVSNSFIAKVEAIGLVGSGPVFVHVGPETYTLDCSQLLHAGTPRTCALIPAHLFGHPADMDAINAFAHDHHLVVVEDASRVHGATYRGKRVGRLRDIVCISLCYSNNLGEYGEASICVTNNSVSVVAMWAFRDHGSHERYQHEIIGANARMDELQVAIPWVTLME